MDKRLLIETLLAYAEKHLALPARDAVYARNLLLTLLQAEGSASPSPSPRDLPDLPDTLMDALKAVAIEEKSMDEESAARFAADVFGLLTPPPSAVECRFAELVRARGPQGACDFLHDLCVKNGYIQKTAISRNLRWEYKDEKNYLEITVNLSKPEKNNKDIAKLLTRPQGNKYPACALCKENEGFAGTQTQPPRRNLRTVRMRLGGEKWFMQYSPYAYYDEHCIVVNEEHVPMHVCENTPAKLLDFVDLFPNYFIGSNASLPIVGGSILNHEHFQGGRHRMPMHFAGISQEFRSREFPDLRIGVLDWYASALRFSGASRLRIEAFAAKIIEAWRNFDCPECDILSHTKDAPHNALSPICRKEGGEYVFDMILRNNRTSERYPEGIFHVHPEHLHIKSEGIGLIEAMGLFILPPRLKRQLKEIEDILCGKTVYDAAALASPENDLHIHGEMIAELMKGGLAKDATAARSRVTDFVNRTCREILGNVAVFKKDEAGRRGFRKFLDLLRVEAL